MAATGNTKKGPEKVDDTLREYVNKGTSNLFTESGRCGPGQTAILTAKQSLQYKGLELCTKPESK